MIKPTPGRIVWYRPHHKENLEVLMDERGKRKDDPLAAIVLAVHSDTRVNLLVISAYGQTRFITRAELWQGEGERPTGHGYAEWMPFQLGQAKQQQIQETTTDTPPTAF
jgi:hypothetical protein